MNKPIIVIAGILLVLITISGCTEIYQLKSCGNGECEGGENAFNCNADCEGIASCKIIKHPYSNYEPTIPLGGDYNFAVEYVNFNTAPNSVQSAGCGAGTQFFSGYKFEGNENNGKVGAYCGNYTINGMRDIGQAKLMNGNTLVNCSGYLTLYVDQSIASCRIIEHPQAQELGYDGNVERGQFSMYGFAIEYSNFTNSPMWWTGSADCGNRAVLLQASKVESESIFTATCFGYADLGPTQIRNGKLLDGDTNVHAAINCTGSVPLTVVE